MEGKGPGVLGTGGLGVGKQGRLRPYPSSRLCNQWWLLQEAFRAAVILIPSLPPERTDTFKCLGRALGGWHGMGLLPAKLGVGGTMEQGGDRAGLQDLGAASWLSMRMHVGNKVACLRDCQPH